MRVIAIVVLMLAPLLPRAASAMVLPPTCSINQTPDTIATPVISGTTVNLSVTCSSGGALTSCTWNRGIASTACSVSLSAPATTTEYMVVPSTAAGAVTVVNTTIFVQPDVSPLPKNCSIGAMPATSPASPLQLGTLVRLDANCTDGIAPIVYIWTIPGFGTVGPQSQLATSPVMTTTYTMTPLNSFGQGNPLTTTVYVGTPIVPPAGCSINQSPNTIVSPVPAGTALHLGVVCFPGGSPPTTCSWNQGIWSTSCAVDLTAPPANTIYTAIPSNAGGPAPMASTTVFIGSNPSSGCSFDIDGDGSIDALSDGLMLMRAMIGLSGEAITANAVSPNATRKTWDEIRLFLNSNCGSAFGP